MTELEAAELELLHARQTLDRLEAELVEAGLAANAQREEVRKAEVRWNSARKSRPRGVTP